MPPVPHDIAIRTRIYRITHADNLQLFLEQDGLYSPNDAPRDRGAHRGIHAASTQADRGNRPVPCGPGGVVRDYVGFYLGPRSPMLLRIKSGRGVEQVPQEQIIYLVTTAQEVAGAGLGFVFTDRHSLANYAAWRDRLEDLNIVDFDIAYADYWSDTPDVPYRQERKQAEFLVHRMLPWRIVPFIGVYNQTAAERVNAILDAHLSRHRPAVGLRPLWYY
jgi:hypothetical protein